MLNKIITGIAQALDSTFNENEEYEIYVDNIEQGLNEPCFFVFTLNPSSKQLVANRYYRTYPFDIHYFPKNANSNIEINEVIEKLFLCFECINIDGNLVKGTNMKSETVDGVLHFFINFNMVVKKALDPIDTMGTLNLTQTLGGE